MYILLYAEPCMSLYYEVAQYGWYVNGCVMLCIDHPIVEQETCKAPGCNRLRYRDSSGRTYDYCSRSCRQPQDGT